MATPLRTLPLHGATAEVREHEGRLLCRWRTATRAEYQEMRVDFLARFGSHSSSWPRRDGWRVVSSLERARLAEWLAIWIAGECISWEGEG